MTTARKTRPFTKRERSTYCTELCRDAMECDRAAGLIRPPFKIDGQLCSHDRACEHLGICRYCETRLPSIPEQPCPMQNLVRAPVKTITKERLLEYVRGLPNWP